MDKEPDFKFHYNGVNYTINFVNLGDILKDFSEQLNEDILEKDTDFAEAKEVIAKIKARL